MSGIKNFLTVKATPAIVLFLFLPLFFYNLGGHSLVDFDEAWYASIATNIQLSKNPIKLSFNGQPYYDHPPLGFGLMAISMSIFGHNEVGARFPSALCAFFGLITLYLIGKNLFGKDVGLASALVLSSCVWFVYRARTADLDSMLLFFYLFTFYATIRSTKSPAWILVLGVAFYATLLTKAMIGITLVPPVIFLVWVRKLAYSTKSAVSPLLAIVLMGLLIVTTFMIVHQFQPTPFNQYLVTGLKLGNRQQIDFKNILGSQTMQYLHFGMGKWYYLGVLGLVGSVVFLKKDKVLLSLYVWIVVLLVGYLSNSKTEIWHLIPLYAPLALVCAYFLSELKDYAYNQAKKIHKDSKNFRLLTQILYIVFFAAIAIFQIYKFKDQIKLFGNQEDPVAYLSKEAKNKPQKLYLDTETFVPAVASFYSNKIVYDFRSSKTENTLLSLLDSKQKDRMIITERWKLEADNIPSEKYSVLAQKNEHLLIEPR